MWAKKRIVLRSWRVQKAEPSGFFVWYDPSREGIELFELEPPSETGVSAACEEDDQGSLWHEPHQVINDRPEDDLPF